MRSLLAILLISWAQVAQADRVIRTPADFVASQFPGPSPAAELVWLTGELREQATAILGHAPASLRLRSWREADKSVWILEEVGKELPITAGFVVEAGRLQTAEVLIYRESRGGEIELPGFLQQYRGLQLNVATELSDRIDNISGATLSVRAMNRMARLALHLHQHLSQG